MISKSSSKINITGLTLALAMFGLTLSAAATEYKSKAQLSEVLNFEQVYKGVILINGSLDRCLSIVFVDKGTTINYYSKIWGTGASCDYDSRKDQGVDRPANVYDPLPLAPAILTVLDTVNYLQPVELKSEYLRTLDLNNRLVLIPRSNGTKVDRLPGPKIMEISETPNIHRLGQASEISIRLSNNFTYIIPKLAKRSSPGALALNASTAAPRTLADRLAEKDKNIADVKASLENWKTARDFAWSTHLRHTHAAENSLVPGTAQRCEQVEGLACNSENRDLADCASQQICLRTTFELRRSAEIALNEHARYQNLVQGAESSLKELTDERVYFAKYGLELETQRVNSGMKPRSRITSREIHSTSEISEVASFRLASDLDFTKGKFIKGQAVLQTENNCQFSLTSEVLPHNVVTLTPAGAEWFVVFRTKTSVTLFAETHPNSMLKLESKKKDATSADTVNCLFQHGFKPSRISVEEKWHETNLRLTPNNG